MPMKPREMERLIMNDGWVMDRTKGFTDNMYIRTNQVLLRFHFTLKTYQ